MGRINTTELPDLAKLIDARLEEPAPVRHLIDGNVIVRSLFNQLEGTDESHGWVSLSQLGACARKLAYRYNGKEKLRVLDGRAKRTFAHGDMAEWWLTRILSESLPEDWVLTKYAPQEQVELEVEDLAITGWPDGILCKSGVPFAVLECKSVNQWGFNRYESEGIDESDSYWWQMQGLMAAAKLPWAAFLIECKNSQAIFCQWVRFDGQAFWAALLEHLQAAQLGYEAAPRRLPDGTELKPVESRYQKPTKGHAIGCPKPDHYKLPWQCMYCDYSPHCRESAVETIERDWQGRPKRGLYEIDPKASEHPSNCPCVGCARTR